MKRKTTAKNAGVYRVQPNSFAETVATTQTIGFYTVHLHAHLSTLEGACVCATMHENIQVCILIDTPGAVLSSGWSICVLTLRLGDCYFT